MINKQAFHEGFITKIALLGAALATQQSKDPSFFRRAAHGSGAEEIAGWPGTVAGGALGGALGGPGGAALGAVAGKQIAGLAASHNETGKTTKDLKVQIRNKLKEIKKSPEGVYPALSTREQVAKTIGGGFLGGAAGLGIGGLLGYLIGTKGDDAIHKSLLGLEVPAGAYYGGLAGAGIGGGLGAYTAGLKKLDSKDTTEYKEYLMQQLREEAKRQHAK